MQAQAPAQSPLAASCIYCRKPLPEPRAKKRRYCSGSCRTNACNLRASQSVTQTSDKARPALPAWAEDPRGELPLLSSAQQTLEEVSSTLSGLARRFQAEELILRRGLDWVRSQRKRQDELERSLAQTRSQLAERDAELHRLRQLLEEADTERMQLQQALRNQTAQKPVLPALSTDLSPQASSLPMPLTVFRNISVPSRLLDGLALVADGCEIAWRFGQAEAQRSSDKVLEGFVTGISLINGSARLAMQNLQAQQGPEESLTGSVLRWRLLHDILPSFDDLYRCVQLLRSTPASPTLTPLHSLVEWVFAVFLSVLVRSGLRPLYPLGEHFDPYSHEAGGRAERRDLPVGSIAEVSHVGFLFEEKLLRPARVVVVCAPAPVSLPSAK